MLDISATALPLVFSLHFEYRINRINISLPSSLKSLNYSQNTRFSTGDEADCKTNRNG